MKEKKGKLTLRYRKKTILRGDTYKILGFADLPIHDVIIAGTEEAFSEKRIEITLNKNGIVAEIIIVSRYAKEVSTAYNKTECLASKLILA